MDTAPYSYEGIMERSRVVKSEKYSGMTVMHLIRQQSSQILLAVIRYTWAPASRYIQ